MKIYEDAAELLLSGWLEPAGACTACIILPKPASDGVIQYGENVVVVAWVIAYERDDHQDRTE